MKNTFDTTPNVLTFFARRTWIRNLLNTPTQDNGYEQLRATPNMFDEGVPRDRAGQIHAAMVRGFVIGWMAAKEGSHPHARY